LNTCTEDFRVGSNTYRDVHNCSEITVPSSLRYWRYTFVPTDHENTWKAALVLHLLVARRLCCETT